MSLEDFVKIDDELSFANKSDHNLKLIKTFVNARETLEDFKEQLKSN